MADYDDKVIAMRNEGKSYADIAKKLGLTEKQVNHAVDRDRKKQKGKIKYEDIRSYTDEDIEAFIQATIEMQEKRETLNTKQVKTTITLEDDKPIGIAYWGDWHIGGMGTDYGLFEQDLRKIRDTEGLYFIGSGDYKDNYITHVHPGSQYEQIIQPGMQDMAVKHYMKQLREKALTLIRGCHDDWDMKSSNKDFIDTLCEITNSVNLWHGGEVTLNVGETSYLWRCRHKFPFQSSLNLENAMRRINEFQGPCDVAAEAHLHNPYFIKRHLMGEYRIMLRTGSYKILDEYGQKLAGYKGKHGIPVAILYPVKDRYGATVEFMDRAISMLKGLRS